MGKISENDKGNKRKKLSLSKKDNKKNLPQATQTITSLFRKQEERKKTCEVNDEDELMITGVSGGSGNKPSDIDSTNAKTVTAEQSPEAHEINSRRSSRLKLRKISTVDTDKKNVDIKKEVVDDVEIIEKSPKSSVNKHLSLKKRKSSVDEKQDASKKFKTEVASNLEATSLSDLPGTSGTKKSMSQATSERPENLDMERCVPLSKVENTASKYSTSDNSKTKSKNSKEKIKTKNIETGDDLMQGSKDEETVTDQTYEIKGEDSQERSEFTTPYYLENFRTVMETVLGDEDNNKLFDDADQVYTNAFSNASGNYKIIPQILYFSIVVERN